MVMVGSHQPPLQPWSGDIFRGLKLENKRSFISRGLPCQVYLALTLLKTLFVQGLTILVFVYIKYAGKLSIHGKCPESLQ